VSGFGTSQTHNFRLESGMRGKADECTPDTLTGWCARRRDFSQRFQADLPCPALLSKTIRFPFDPNHIFIPCYPVPEEGRWPLSRTLGWDAVDAAASSRAGNAGRVYAREHSTGVWTNGAASASLKLSGRAHAAEVSWRKRVADGKAVWS
jgi:hypothetical protein